MVFQCTVVFLEYFRSPKTVQPLMIQMVKPANPFDPGRTPCSQSVSSPFRIDKVSANMTPAKGKKHILIFTSQAFVGAVTVA